MRYNCKRTIHTEHAQFIKSSFCQMFDRKVFIQLLRLINKEHHHTACLKKWEKDEISFFFLQNLNIFCVYWVQKQLFLSHGCVCGIVHDNTVGICWNCDADSIAKRTTPQVNRTTQKFHAKGASVHLMLIDFLNNFISIFSIIKCILMLTAATCWLL